MLHKDYAERRKKLLAALDSDSIGIISAAPEVVRNGDSHFLYRQNSDFYYFTGLSEADAVAIFALGSEFGDFILFNRPKDKVREQWDGVMAGQEDACQIYGADSSFPFADIDAYLLKLMQGRSKVYFDLDKGNFDNHIITAIAELRRQVRAGAKAPTSILSLEQITHEMRLFKSQHEIELMRHAAKATVAGHKKAMQVCKPGMREYHLAAEVFYEFQKHGCQTSAYNSIVGSGANGCVLHYVQNDAELKSGDLVLIDAGGEYKSYAADITRTFPINGKYSSEQKAIYEIVLNAQKAALAVIKPSTVWTHIQEVVVKTITQGLIELGLLKGNLSKLIEEKAYLPFYMHKPGHWLGMDVHDVGSYKVNGEWRRLQTDMVITVEPGIYISAGNTRVPEKWWNIGVRIEDDVLITPHGNDVLSKDLVKEVADIEALMRD